MKKKLEITLPETEDYRELKNLVRELMKLLKQKQGSLSDYIPAKDISEHFRLTEQTLSKYADKKEYEKYYFGDKNVFYRLSELESFIERSIEPNKGGQNE